MTVTPLATQVEPYREGLVAGRRYTRDTLLWSALLNSGNDSATALALDVGDGSLGAFYALANAKVANVSLVDANLGKLDLSGFDFSGCQAKGADFAGSPTRWTFAEG